MVGWEEDVSFFFWLVGAAARQSLGKGDVGFSWVANLVLWAGSSYCADVLYGL